jgi:hypothetical protein
MGRSQNDQAKDAPEGKPKTAPRSISTGHLWVLGQESQDWNEESVVVCEVSELVVCNQSNGSEGGRTVRSAVADVCSFWFLLVPLP